MGIDPNGTPQDGQPIGLSLNSDYRLCKGRFTTSFYSCLNKKKPGRVAKSVARLTQESEAPGSISGPATCFCSSFR